jgi:hypothetical protein
MSAQPPEQLPRSPGLAFLDGIQAALRSVFIYVLLGNYVGIGALCVGFVAFLIARQSVFVGVVAGEAAVMLGAYTFGP